MLLEGSYPRVPARLLGLKLAEVCGMRRGNAAAAENNCHLCELAPLPGSPSLSPCLSLAWAIGLAVADLLKQKFQEQDNVSEIKIRSGSGRRTPR